MSKKERMEGKLNELWTKWDDVDIDDVPEEELEKIGEELENLMGQIGYGTKSIFVHTQMEKYYQVIKLQDGFLFHFVGKKDINRLNCIHTEKYIDQENLQKGDFILRNDKIKKIIIDCANILYGIWGQIKFKVGLFGKSFALDEQLGPVDYKKFFGEKLTIKNEGQSLVQKIERDAMARIQNENNATE